MLRNTQKAGAARRIIASVAAGLAFLSGASFGQETGTISGRIQNVATGDYLHNARVSVAGTDIVAFTNSFGEYRLSGVPAGEVTIRAFYTGLDTQEIAVRVTAGETARQDVRLTSRTRYGESDSAGDIVELDGFTIQETRDTDANAIAINEQRFAPNIKSVVDAKAFGDVTEGNIGEFIKYLPGVTVDYVAADVRTISVRGFADNFTTVNVDGARMASSASGNSIRTFELEQVSINNVSRIEVVKVPTPDIAADSLGGSVNMISKSAFERSRASFDYKTYFNFNSEETKLFSKTPGPKDKTSYKVLPGLEFSYVNPVNERFGYVINGLTSNQFNEQHRSQPTWRHGGAGASNTAPYLRQYQLQDGPKNTFRDSLSFKGDWRVAEDQTVSLGYQFNYYKSFFGNRNLNFDVGSNNVPTPGSGTPLTYGPDFTHGATGRGAVNQGGAWRDKLGATHAGVASWRLSNRDWDINAGLNASKSKTWYRADSRGHFSGYSIQMRDVSRVLYDDITTEGPQQFTVLNAAGQQLDPYSLSNFQLMNVTSNPVDSFDKFTGGDVNVERHFRTEVPFSLKGGAAIRRQERDMRRTNQRWNFVGADGVANSGDDNAAQFIDGTYSGEDPHWGFPEIEWPSPYGMYRRFESNPGQFVWDGVFSEANRINGSEEVTEWVTSAYLMGRTRLMEGRLQLVTGARFEKTEIHGRGPLFLPHALPGDPTTAEEVRRVRIERGYSANSSYDGVYPGFHATYNITPNLLARFAYAKTLGRPDFSNVIPNATINEDQSNPDSVTGTINIRNTGLRPWEADNFDLSVEYYPETGGVLSGGVFRKNVSDFFGVLSRPATAEDLQFFGLDSQYLGWDLVSTINSGDARIDGFEFNYVQPLVVFGEWGRHLNLTMNGTELDLHGANDADFRRFIPRSGNIGLTFSMKPVVVMVKWNYRGQQRMAPNTANGLVAGHEYYASRYNLDLNFEYRLSDRFTFFANTRNVTNRQQVLQRFNDDTPDYARNFRLEEFGVQWTVGVKGTF